jgi:peptide/nickel transport system permease protein
MNAATEALFEHEARQSVRSHKAGGAGLGILIVLLLLGLLHEQIAPFAVGANAAGPPLAGPSAMHPFGTDILGRDLWSEAIHGLHVLLLTSIAAFAFAFPIGALAGRISVYLLGRFGRAIRIVVNVLAAIPSVLLAIVLVGLMGPEYFLLAAGLALIPAVFVEHFDRAQGHRNAAYIEYARASGVADSALLRRDLVDWTRDALVADAASVFSAAIIVVSTVSYFGFGALPPTRDLGLVIASASSGLPDAWWMVAGPAAFLVALVMAVRAAGGLNRSLRR